MSAEQTPAVAGPWTRHGHAIPGVTVVGAPEQPPVARCGGPALCSKCRQDAEEARAARTGDGLSTRAVELEAAERWARAAMDGPVPSHLATLLAEYDRRGAELQQLLTTRDVRELTVELEQLLARVAELETGPDTEWGVRDTDSRQVHFFGFGPWAERFARMYAETPPVGMTTLMRRARGSWTEAS